MNALQDADSRFMGSDASIPESDPVGVVIVPVPFEKTSSYGRGSLDGPQAILRASHDLEFHDTDLQCEPWKTAGGIGTLHPLAFGENDDGARVADRLEEVVNEWLDRGVKVVTLGGEHTSIVGAVRAHAQRFDNLTVLQLDAHSDLRGEYLGDPWNHACAMARVVDFHQNIVQVGIRSEAAEEAVRAAELDLPVFRGSTIQRDAARNVDWITPIIDACAENVYVTLDLDVFDPSVIPATGTPEPGGFSWMQMNQLFAALCRSRNVVGFDVCELAPIEGIHHPQFTAAKLVYRFIGLMFSRTTRDGAAHARFSAARTR